ncbi:MAG: hypothetical protein K0Q76_1172 [Panacagrimonas sp.]|jgi:hypothetical protein|nr:MAPEG family protein [Panacagrimonas sp.]MCC2656064.1 hypothetical protein [Panacagrimonas sp.]
MNASLPMPLLGPLVAMLIWCALMWLWMYVTRIPAINASKMVLDGSAPRGEQMATLPARVRWKADNYNHLLEQPQQFYAVAIVLALLGDTSQTSLMLAWAYVGLRVVHSLWQSLVNVIVPRFALFALSSLVLFALVARAAMIVFG